MCSLPFEDAAERAVALGVHTEAQIDRLADSIARGTHSEAKIAKQLNEKLSTGAPHTLPRGDASVQVVRLVGLTRAELNGLVGLSRGWDARSGRWKVKLPGSDAAVLLRTENLETPPPGQAHLAFIGSVGDLAVDELSLEPLPFKPVLRSLHKEFKPPAHGIMPRRFAQERGDSAAVVDLMTAHTKHVTPIVPLGSPVCVHVDSLPPIRKLWATGPDSVIAPFPGAKVVSFSALECMDAEKARKLREGGHEAPSGWFIKPGMFYTYGGWCTIKDLPEWVRFVQEDVDSFIDLHFDATGGFPRLQLPSAELCCFCPFCAGDQRKVETGANGVLLWQVMQATRKLPCPGEEEDFGRLDWLQQEFPFKAYPRLCCERCFEALLASFDQQLHRSGCDELSPPSRGDVEARLRRFDALHDVHELAIVRTAREAAGKPRPERYDLFSLWSSHASGGLANALQDVVQASYIKFFGYTSTVEDGRVKVESRPSEWRSCAACGIEPASSQACDRFQFCQRCRQVVYCSKDCQRADWKEHIKKVCKK